MSTVPEGNKNRSAKEGKEKFAGPGSSQEMLTSEGNATAQESGQEIFTSDYEDNSKVPDHGQEISRSEHEGNVAVPQSDQEILTLEHDESTESETSHEILTSVLEDMSTAPGSNQTCLTLATEDKATVPESNKEILSPEHENESTEPESGQDELKSENENKSNALESSEECLVRVHEDNSTKSEIGQKMLKSEYEDTSKVLETGQEKSISDREDNATVAKISKKILSSEHEGNASVPGNFEEIIPSQLENKTIVLERGQGLLTSEHGDNSTVAESGQEMITSEKTDRKSEQYCENIPSVPISERDILHRFVVAAERVWKVVNTLTGFKFGIIPPMCLSHGQKVGHWIKLSKEVIPFVYVTSKGGSITELNEISFSSGHINTKPSTAALLIPEYVNRVINQLELEQSDALESVKETLKVLYCLLQSFIKDVDSITLSNTTRNLPQTMSKIKELEHSIDQLSFINRSDLTTPIEKMVTTTESHLLCIIIGLGDKFTQKMIDITDERAMHESPYYIIEHFIEGEIDKIVMDRGNEFQGDIKSKLVLLGFSQEKSQTIIEKFSSHSYRTNSKFYLVKEYLENLFSTHPLLTKMPFLDRYANQPVGRWFDDEVYQRTADEENARKLHFQVIKFETVYNCDLTSGVINRKFQEYGHTLLFHGAKHASYLESFLRDGIKLSRSVNQQDFSNGIGFYLSDDFEAATDWADKRGHRPNAVIIYRVPNNLLVFGDTAGLDLSSDTELWSSVVKYHRTGFSAEQDVPDRVNLNNRSFIKGPVCQNGMYLRKGIYVKPKAFLMNDRELQQYSIRGEKLAKELSSFVAGVVIY